MSQKPPANREEQSAIFRAGLHGAGGDGLL